MRIKLFIFVYAFIMIFANNSFAETSEVNKFLFYENPQPIDNLAVSDINDNETDILNEDFNLLLINFWATWCSPCTKEMPSLNELQSKFEKNQLKIITIATGRNNPNKIVNFFEEYNLTNLENYRDPNKPAFATITFKGGGDATAAGRSVLETGEFDYAWNLQLAPEVIANMEKAGKGVAIAGFGPLVERLEMNMTDPSPSLDADTRSTVKAPHPFLTDMNVRKALSMAIDRPLLVEIGYGKAGDVTCDLVPAPDNYAANNDYCVKQDIAGANALLDSAGWKKGGDGIRQKDGVRLSILYQTSTNAVRQDFQALIKEWWSQIGVETELRNLNASVFFGGDPGSPDTFQKFYADVEMYANTFDGTDPENYLGMYRCGNEPKPESQWQGENINRYCDPKYDALLDELSQTGDLGKRGEIAIKLNNMLTKDSYTIVPSVHRGRVSAHSNTLGGVILNTWDSELWNTADWYRK